MVTNTSTAAAAAAHIVEAMRLHGGQWGADKPSHWGGSRRLCAAVRAVEADRRVRVVAFRPRGSPWGLAVCYDRRHVATVFYPDQGRAPVVQGRDPSLDRPRGRNAAAAAAYEAARQEAGRLLREGGDLPLCDGQEGGYVRLPSGREVSAMGALCAAHGVTRAEAAARHLWEVDVDVDHGAWSPKPLRLHSAEPLPAAPRLHRRGGGGSRRLSCEWEVAA